MYINEQKNAAGSHGNPHSNPIDGSVVLPEELLTDYIACRGFAELTVEDGIVTVVEENTDALNAYLAEYPDEPSEDEPSAQDDTDTMLIDHELRLTLLELGL